MPVGTILGFSGSWGSGLATLMIKARRGVRSVYCDNGATVRALDDCFGDVIGEGHTVNQKAIAGKRIRYGLDEMGLTLEWFEEAKQVLSEMET